MISSLSCQNQVNIKSGHDVTSYRQDSDMIVIRENIIYNIITQYYIVLYSSSVIILLSCQNRVSRDVV